MKECTCNHCGKTFIPRTRSNDINKYCSRECYFEYRRVNPRVKQLPVKTCVVCNNIIEGTRSTKYCSDECRMEKNRRLYQERYKVSVRDTNPVVEKKCKECGNIFSTNYMSNSRHYCSDICSRKNSRRVGKGIRRARIYGVGYESISPIEIFKRDGWKCRLCGVKTPYRLRGTCEDNAPELDHLIPLSLGGQHNKTNVQCLCRKCNINKGATIQGQFILFG